LDLIARLQGETATADTPVIVYLENALSRRGEAALKRLKENAVVREAQSPERLLDNVVLYAHVKHAALSDATRKVIDATRSSRTILAEKTVLVVDDDVRNIFALGTVLEPQNMKVLAAENGRQAIDILQRERDVDAVLMDIMMPEMDGYDTMRAIRRIGRLRALPIIALTAKAMKGDREKCLEAGASDYVSKPVDTEQLLGVLRAWLYR
jgi:CheY-like chemotaxis protein